MFKTKLIADADLNISGEKFYIKGIIMMLEITTTYPNNKKD